MTVVGLHPEELFDKLLGGDLTPGERERLHQHLSSCDVCRFEYEARGDFQAEAVALAASGPPPLLPLRGMPVPPVVASPVRRRRSRIVIWGLAAAALISASGAVASGVVGQASWRSVSLIFSQSTPATQPALSTGPPAVVRAVAAPPAAASVPALAPGLSPSARSEPELAKAGDGPAAGHLANAQRAASRGAALTTVVKEPVEGTPAKGAALKEVAPAEPSSPAKLFTEANQARRSGDIGRASGLYYLLQDKFPGSAEAELSRVTLSLLLLDSGDAQGALTGFERYLAGSSRGLEAEALVGRARALGRLGRRELEGRAWQEVKRKYPSSIYGRQASERLSALGLP